MRPRKRPPFATGGFATLELVEAQLRGPPPSDPRSARDYAVNGRPLSRLLPRHDLRCPFGWVGRHDEARHARQLLGEQRSELAAGRVPLYVCSQCGDLGCGAITVLLERTERAFVWKDFGRESSLPRSAVSSLAEGYEFHFEREAYVSVFRAFR